MGTSTFTGPRHQGPTDLRSLVLRRMAELLESRKQSIISGGCKDMAEYHRLVGFIEGVTQFYGDIQGLLHDEDDDLIGTR